MDPKRCKACGQAINENWPHVTMPIFKQNFHVDTWYFHSECFDPENLPEESDKGNGICCE